MLRIPRKKPMQTLARDNYQSHAVQPHVFNPIISLPIFFVFQRSEAESLIKSKMRKRQYRPRGSKKPRPLRLPLLNPKVSIHDAGSTHKKEPDVLILPESFVKPSCDLHTPVFCWCSRGGCGLSGTSHAVFTHFSCCKMEQTNPDNDLEKKCFMFCSCN